MIEFSFAEVKRYDEVHGTGFVAQIREVCDRHAIGRSGAGVFCQLRTDWTSGGVVYALWQTLRYVGYGYDDPMIFKNLGKVIGRVFTTMMESVEDKDTS